MGVKSAATRLGLYTEELQRYGNGHASFRAGSDSGVGSLCLGSARQVQGWGMEVQVATAIGRSTEAEERMRDEDPCLGYYFKRLDYRLRHTSQHLRTRYILNKCKTGAGML